MRHAFAGVALTLLPMALAAQEMAGLPAPMVEKVTAAREACASFNGGEFALEWGAVTRTDLDGDMYPDWVLDESGFSCSTAASLYCGTGGCASHFLVGDVLTSLRNQGWTMATIGSHRVLLADVHGSRCGGINPTPCFLAHAWDAEARVWRVVTEPDRVPL